MTIRSVGHGTLPADDLLALLRSAGVEVVADVRRYPGSSRHPHVAREAMARWLPEAGVDYQWIEALGGRRRPSAGSRHLGLRNQQFRAYADHMASEDFGAGLRRLRELAAERSVAALCAESLWWRCHRRLIADHLVLVDHIPVEHLFHDGRCAPHVPTPHARVDGGDVVYDAVAALPLDAAGGPP